MKLKEYKKIIDKLVKEGHGEKEVIYSSDDEGILIRRTKMKFIVSTCYTAMERIEIEANNEDEAKEIVASGEYKKEAVIDRETDDFQIVDCEGKNEI